MEKTKQEKNGQDHIQMMQLGIADSVYCHMFGNMER